jgi:predicted Zn-ribbon and HTH transcriptional regulator
MEIMEIMEIKEGGMMEFMDVMTIAKVRESMKDDLILHEIANVAFCKKCGYQVNDFEDIEICPICETGEFVTGVIASKLAGYLALDKMGLLKKYYDKETGRKFSAVKMNNKRIVFQLLVRDRLVEYDDREMEKFVQRTMWRKF